MRFSHSSMTTWMILFIIAAFVILAPYPSKVAAANEDNDVQIVILFDLGHGQFFNQSLFSKALNSLKNESLCGCDFKIRFSRGDFNSSILSGVDILVMTNPEEKTSLNDLEDIDRQKSQQYAIAHWFLQGKGIFLLSNPFDKTNDSLSGHPDPLLRVIRSDYLQVGGVDMRANYLAHNTTDVTNGRASITRLSNINISISPILNDPHNVSAIVTKSASVRVSIEDTASGLELIKSDLASFAVTKSGKVEEVEIEPTIFATIEYVPTEEDYEITKEEIAQTGRIALSGSTLMFSDLPAYEGSSDSWINLEDNLDLWTNTILWLAGSPQADVPITVEEEGSVAATTFGVLGGLSLGLFLLGTGVHFYGSSKPLEPLQKLTKDEEPRKRKKKRQIGVKRPGDQIRRKKK